MFENKIISAIQNSIETKKAILDDQVLLNTISEVASTIIKAYKNNKKVLFCGNGGSAADAQHLAAELTG
ncbi:MAG: SIS domain-containing protein, partial [Desulfurella sp.]|uniref:SIS domain-containing protein n=1 Tax=Desulfurella sp. TaxID=1962857 RepID=UPI003D0E5083